MWLSVLEPRWLRMVAPATLCLRLALVLAVFAGPLAGLEVALAARAVAAAMALAYAAAYAAVASGYANPRVLAYALMVDSVLVGLLVGAAGEVVQVVGMLALLVLALAQVSGGVALVLLASIGLAGGWAVSRLAELPALVYAAASAVGPIDSGLEVETVYRSMPMGAAKVVALPTAALAVLLTVCVAGAVALLRAFQEQRRAAAALAEVDALEAIVDCFAGNAGDEELWNVVLRSATALTGARVYSATIDSGVIRLRSTGGAIIGSEADQTAEWILLNLRIPQDAEQNLLASALRRGAERETKDLRDLCAGSLRSISPGIIDKLTSTWQPTFLIVPIALQMSGAALLAVTPVLTDQLRRSVRAVAERTALVLRAPRLGTHAHEEQVRQVRVQA